MLFFTIVSAIIFADVILGLIYEASKWLDKWVESKR
jgi:hypothetical protein